MQIFFLSKGEKSRRYKLQLFPADICNIYKEMLKYQETLQAKSSQFFLAHYWVSSVLQNLQTRTVIHRKRLFKSFVQKMVWQAFFFFSLLEKTLGFLCFQYGFTLFPTDLSESLQSTISICCKKAVTVRNLSL